MSELSLGLQILVVSENGERWSHRDTRGVVDTLAQGKCGSPAEVEYQITGTIHLAGDEEPTTHVIFKSTRAEKAERMFALLTENTVRADSYHRSLPDHRL